MTRDELLEKLAPCGLDCSRCASFNNGEISEQSRALLSSLGNYKRMAEKMSSFFEPFSQYEAFEKILSFFANAGCDGCRAGGKNCLPGCGIKSCFVKQDADFCGECRQFPCDKSGLKENLYQRWLENGGIIKEKGAEAFYDIQAEKARY